MYCIYLRKSRSDYVQNGNVDIEKTLESHERTLLALAKSLNYPIGAIYKEVVSGETIASRPVMQQLLSEVEQGAWDGVFVHEVERLARGDTVDQGIVAQTFKYSNTKIITPTKTYDPENEFDEEYFEFGLFMSRREYKIINRRQNAGRLAAVKAGKFPANRAPFGWERVKLQGEKGWTLRRNEDQAPYLAAMVDWYMNEKLGTRQIANRLDELHVPTHYSGKYWTNTAVTAILKSPVHAGKNFWGRCPQKKVVKDGRIVTTRLRNQKVEYYDGLWTDERYFDFDYHLKILEEFNSRSSFPINCDKSLKNPLSRVVVCGKCGKPMARKPAKDDGSTEKLYCKNPHCDNISGELSLIEERLIEALEDWLKDYKIQITQPEQESIPAVDVYATSINNLQSEVTTLQKQLDNMYDLLEQGIYTPEIFVTRSTTVTQKITDAQKSIDDLKQSQEALASRQKAIIEFVPRVESIIDYYKQTDDIETKNALLLEVLDKVTYVKEKRGYNCSREELKNMFDLVIFPKLPK